MDILIESNSTNGDKWQLKTLFLSVFDPRLSIVESVFDCHLSGVPLVRNPKSQIIPGAKVLSRS